MKFGLVPKLIAAELLVLTIAMGGLVAAVYWTFEADLSAYLLRVETEQLEPLVQDLGEEYVRHGGWHFLSGRGRGRGPGPGWAMRVSRAIDGTSSPPAIAPTGGPPMLSQDVIGILPRLSLVDADGYEIIRTPLPGRSGWERPWVILPIMVDGQQVGALRMLPTPVPAKGLDRQYRNDQLMAFITAAVPALVLTALLAIPLGYHFVQPHAAARPPHSPVGARRLFGAARDQSPG